MKELTIEEKAKAYDDALERAREWSETKNGYYTPKELCEEIFPELEENEDEKVRKHLISLVKNWDKDGIVSKYTSDANDIKKILSWLEKQGEQNSGTIDIDKMVSKYSHTKDGNFGLPVNCQIRAYRQGINDVLNLLSGIEKQGEQKPVDKVEPKFHEGEWINGYYTNYKVLSVNNDGYLVEDTDGNKINILFENEKFHHLWTIDDAKDGDVLASDNSIFIFKEEYIAEKPIAYCGLMNGRFLVDGEDACWTNERYYPATKEQRDTLEKAMADAGYTFDFKKKELKKISQRMVSAEAKESLYDNPAWSEEDENTIKVLMNIIRKSEIIDSIIYTDSLKEKLYDWLKSLKDRVQPKQEWNKGDMEMLNAAISFVELSSFTTIGKGKNNTVAWLKSLKSRVIPQSRQEWGKEDETKMHAALAFIKSEFPKKGDEEIMEDTIEWLKSLRPQPKQEWSEEDEKNLQGIIDEIQANKNSAPSYDIPVYEGFLNWLNSLKQRIGGEV